MKNMTKIALIATCAGLLTACGGGSDNLATGGDVPDTDPENPPMTFEERIAAQNDLIDQGAMAQRTAEMIKDRFLDGDDKGRILSGTNHMNAHGRSAVVRHVTKTIIDRYNAIEEELDRAHDAVMKLHRISENESLTDEEQQNAENLLVAAQDYRDEIQEILGYMEGGENDETVRRDPVPLAEASALRQAYDYIVGDETDMLEIQKIPAAKEKEAAMAVWKALETVDASVGLNKLDDNDNAFATGDYKQSGAMRFADIAGPLKTVFIGPREYKAVSVKNMKPSEGGADKWGVETHKRMQRGERATYPFTYQGIEGSVVCRGECVTTETDPIKKPDDRFDDGWYFVPVEFKKGGTAVKQENEDKSGSYFVMKGEDKYEEALLVRYGMWLDSSSGLHREVGVDRENGRDNGVPDITTVSNDINGLAPNAIYTGNAEGLAARKHETEMATGQFEARVLLRATFGGNPVLSGAVHSFQAGKYRTRRQSGGHELACRSVPSGPDGRYYCHWQ